MQKYIKRLEHDFSEIKNGFKEFEKRAQLDFESYEEKEVYALAKLAYQSEVYQVRMYAVFLFGYLSDDKAVLHFMKEEVSKDKNWRVQEILAKSFDEHCKRVGYEQSLDVIDEWLHAEQPNTRRAVTEGLRIWTSRPYFNENPQEAIKRLSNLRLDSSEYVRKSVGNALKDISKKFPELVKSELKTWGTNKAERQVYQLASKFIGTHI